MNLKYLMVVCSMIMLTPFASALFFEPETPPPQVINNNTNLSLGGLTLLGDINMNSNSIYNVNWVNVTNINMTNIFGTLYGDWNGSDGYLTIADYIINITAINLSMKNYVDSVVGGEPLWTANQSLYVPYTGATGDVDLGIHDLDVDDIIADDVIIDDLWVTDDTVLGDNVEIAGTLDVNGTSEFTENVAIVNNNSIFLEVETTNPEKSAEIRLLANDSQDLYIYTYGSYVGGIYYGLPRGNTSLIDARGERLVIGTFDNSPLYLATGRDPRWIITENGDYIPFDDEDYDIGNVTNRVRDIYVLGEDDQGGIHFVEDDDTMGNLSMDDDFNLLWNGNIIFNASGNITVGGGGTYDDDWINLTINKTIPIVMENTTIARTGDCPSGYVVQNTTTDGVECVVAGSGGASIELNEFDIYFTQSSHSNINYYLNESDVSIIEINALNGSKYVFGGIFT